MANTVLTRDNNQTAQRFGLRRAGTANCTRAMLAARPQHLELDGTKFIGFPHPRVCLNALSQNDQTIGQQLLTPLWLEPPTIELAAME